MEHGRRLAIFCDRFPELSETFVTDEVRELRRRGFNVTVYASAPHRRDESWHEDVAVEPLQTDLERRPNRALPALHTALARPRAVGRDLRDQRRWRAAEPAGPLRRLAPAVQRLRRERTRHIHVHFAAGAALYALRASRLSGIPFSITAHAHEIFAGRANLRDKLAEAAFTTVPCAYNVTELARVGLPVERVHVRMLGTDIRRVRRSGALPRDGFTLAVGRLVEKKGFHVLVEAAARRDLGPICIVGDGPWRGRLEQLIADRSLGDQVSLVGAAARDEVRSWMDKAGLLVAPSVTAANGDKDALPVVLWEALAMELPVVGATLAGIPEIVRPPWGTLVESGDPEGLADAIAAWRATPYTERVRAGKAGREWVEAHHTRERAVDQLLELIDASESTRRR
jgi:colanic acid/amylovoran biosynthesis glycosyltransferase